MHKIIEYKNSIITALHHIASFASLANKAGHFDLNKAAEEFYRELLNMFYDWSLAGLNTEEEPSYEGVDLGCIANKVAIQVTSENDSAKVHKSIRGFRNKALKDGYTELYILMFKGKPTFPKADFSESVNNEFLFDKNKHIIDHGNLCSKLQNMEFTKIERIYNYLLTTGAITSYTNLDEPIDDLGIVDNIFKYIKDKQPNKTTRLDFSSSGPMVDIVKKIKINFPENQQERVNMLMTKVWDKKQIVGEYLSNIIEDDELSVTELQYEIQEKFCELTKSSHPNAPVDDINIIKNMALEYIPKDKRTNLSYICNAQAFIFHFFELCYIGNKTDPNSQPQLSLFQ